MMFRSVIPVFLSAFENQNLCVVTSGFFRGPRLMVDGVIREPAGKYYVLQDTTRKYVRLRLRRRFLDPIPTIQIGDDTIEIAPPFRWYEHFWMSLSASLIYLHWGLGLLLGLFAYSVNTRIFRSYQSKGMKFLFSGFVTFGALGAFLFLAFVAVGVIGFLRIQQTESELNARGLKEIHAVHEPFRQPSGLDAPSTVDVYGYPLAHVDRRHISSLLRTRQFAQLNAELDQLQALFVKDFRAEQSLAEGYYAFAVGDSALEVAFNQWVATYPGSYIPYLARATYYHALAWKCRGGRWAAETPAENFERMESYFDASYEDITTALSIEPQLLVAYHLLIDAARARGTDMLEDYYTKKALTLCPWSFITRTRHMLNLLPRWGGSYPAMNAFARESMKFAALNPKLALLQGYADWDQGRVAEGNKEYEKSIQCYTRALQYGEYALFRYERGRTYLDQDQYEEAFTDLSKAEEGNPYDTEILTSLAAACYHRGAYPEAFKYLHIASEVDPQGTEANEWTRWIGHDLVVRGYERAQAGDIANAIAFYTRAVEFDPEDPEPYYYRAYAFFGSGNDAQAISDARTAIRFDPHHFESYRLLDNIYARRRDWNTIISYWDRFLALEPENAQAYLERSGTYYLKGDMAASLRDAETACKLGESQGCLVAKRIKSGEGQR